MDVTKQQLEEFEEKSRLLRVISHPVRLYIIKQLIRQEGRNVTEMNEELNLPQSTFSQHLGKLKNTKIVKGQRHGVEIRYFLVNDFIRKIVGTLSNNDFNS